MNFANVDSARRQHSTCRKKSQRVPAELRGIASGRRPRSLGQELQIAMKELKTGSELAVMLMREARRVHACKSCTGIAVRRAERTNSVSNWEVRYAENASPICIGSIGEIAARLQKIYDLAD